MRVEIEDLQSLRQGIPPTNGELLSAMTLGREHWLDRFKNHYLENYIAQGGSKVKVLVGKEGSGKTHLLRCVENDARSLGYEVVFISARDIFHRLNDLPNLYRTVAQKIDLEMLVRGLCQRVAANLGYDSSRYDGADRLLPVLVEEEGLTRDQAMIEIRRAAGRTFREIDFSPSFTGFCYSVARDRMIHGNNGSIELALKWLAGEKMERRERQSTSLFEKLQKSNARSWINSLVHLLKVAGRAGLVVIIDDLEVITERDPMSGRFLYTPNAIKDTCEIFRQVIDDVEMLNSFMLLLAGRQEIVEDERRGFPSYEALWMRLQTGLIPGERFNPFSDMVDVDAHLRANGLDFPTRAASHLSQVLESAGLKRRFQDLPAMTGKSELVRMVIETAMLAEMGGIN